MTVAKASIEVFSEQADQLGECPVWDGRIGQLSTIDIDGRAVHRHDPATGARTTRTLDGRPGSIALTDDPDRLLVAVEHELWFLHWPSGRHEPWLALEEAGRSIRLNDGRCDPAGRFWVGSMHDDGVEPIGSLHRVEADGTTAVVRTGVTIANGLAFSPDGASMWFADSVEECVWRHDLDPATGLPTGERTFNDFSELPGFPDGACLDEDGCYWTACVFGSAIARLTPEGAVDRIVEVPVRKPTMPAFGGDDLDTMFLTSIGGGGSHPRPEEPGLDGMVLAIDVGVRGIAEPTFGTR